MAQKKAAKKTTTAKVKAASPARSVKGKALPQKATSPRKPVSTLKKSSASSGKSVKKSPKKKPSVSKSVECEIVDAHHDTVTPLKDTKTRNSKLANTISTAKNPGTPVRNVQAEILDPEEQDAAAPLDPSDAGPVDADWDPEQDFVDIQEVKPKKKILKKKKSENALVPAGSKALTTSADAISAYLNEIRKYPLLTKEQEIELARHYFETKDPAAAQALVTANLRFVVKVAAEYSKFGARLIDLVQEGNMGLMHAVREFNPYKGVRLITYAVWWIRGYIQEYLLKQYSMVKIATTQNQKRLFYRLQKEKDLLDAMGEAPDMKLIGEKMGIPTNEVEQMANRLSGRDVSLNTPLDEGSTSSLMDLQKSTETGVDDQIAAQEEVSLLREKLEELRDDLSDREKIILEERLLADEPLTLQEIGEKYGITREAVRQMEARLMKKIRDRYLASLVTATEEE